MKNSRVSLHASRSLHVRTGGVTAPCLKISAGLALLLLAGTVYAAPPLPQCTISASPVIFGNYDPLSATPGTGTGTLTFQCQSGVAGGGITYTISLSSGSGTFAQRTLTSGPNVLNYNLYTDPTLTTVWGDGSAGTGTVSTTVTKSNATAGVTNTVYGNIPALQDVVPGSYSDNITVTVNF